LLKCGFYCLFLSITATKRSLAGAIRVTASGDKQAQEQLRLISELDNDDRAIIFKMIDKMLTSKKFKDFFNKNVASL